MATETFGSILRRLMKEKKITHKALSQLAGVHRTTITDYVNERRLPPEETFRRIHQAIPDKELYDAYFEAVSPKERANKPLIPNKETNNDTYNFYKAAKENTNDVQEFIKNLASKAAKSVNVEAPSKKEETKKSPKNTINPAIAKERMYIAHALLYITTFFEENEELTALAPTDYLAYKQLFEKYSSYLNIDPYM